jgi:hypothetical protein
VSVALGLGKTVVEGGRAVRFCPVSPRKPIQSFTPEDHLENSQRSFVALDMSGPQDGPASGAESRLDLVPLDIEVAERHGTLAAVASTYSPDDDAIHDGLSRAGVRLVTMAGVLKGKVFPLADVTAFLLRVGAAASSCPVEIEFAVSLSEQRGAPHEFAFLQIRPLVLGAEAYEVTISDLDTQAALCLSHKALGNGYIRGVRDVIYVRPRGFDRANTVSSPRGRRRQRQTAAREASYVLIGPTLAAPTRGSAFRSSGRYLGRSLHRRNALCGPARRSVTGLHFFQNIVSFGIGYLTIDPRDNQDRLDTEWLDRCQAETDSPSLRHISFGEPLRIALNGRTNVGVVLKPE